MMDCMMVVRNLFANRMLTTRYSTIKVAIHWYKVSFNVISAIAVGTINGIIKPRKAPLMWAKDAVALATRPPRTIMVTKLT